MSSPGPSKPYIWLGIPETSESRALNTQINRMWTKAENTCPGMNHTSFPASPQEMPILTLTLKPEVLWKELPAGIMSRNILP